MKCVAMAGAISDPGALPAPPPGAGAGSPAMSIPALLKIPQRAIDVVNRNNKHIRFFQVWATQAAPGKERSLRGRNGTVIAISLSVALVVALAILGPYLYDRMRRSSAEASRSTEEAEEFKPLTHDELLGPPLSFETPAFIRIPAVEIDEEVREGSDIEEELYTILSVGPVHLTHTGFPGWPGNCVISGHRTTKTRPFNRLDELEPGDAVFIRNPRGLYEYQVNELRYIDPSEDVTGRTEEPILTLTTCAPEGDATLRLVVRAELVGFTPVEEMESGE